MYNISFSFAVEVSLIFRLTNHTFTQLNIFRCITYKSTEFLYFLEQHQQQNGYEPQQNGYEEQAANVNGVHDQEVPNDNAAYEEVNGHVANGEDVVDRDVQNGMEAEPMQQEVRIGV